MGRLCGMVGLAHAFGGALRVPFVAFVCRLQGYGVARLAGMLPSVVTWYVWGREVVGKRWSPLV